MKVYLFLWATCLSSAAAWNVDKRCLGEGQLVAGDEVDAIFDEMDFEIDDEDDYEVFELDEANFDWDNLSILGSGDEEEEAPGLRGTFVSLSRNQPLFSNSTRNLQSGRTFNIKLYWKKGACWQGTQA